MTTLFICNCCGKIAQAQTQPVLVPGRAPLIQVECLTVGCNNRYMTYAWKQGDNNEQLTNLYTPVTMDADQEARFIEAIEFKAKAG